MQSRTTLSAQFSSFAIVEENSFQGWILDPRLHRSMERCLAQVASDTVSEQQSETARKPPHQTAGDRVWAIYWHRLWLRRSHGHAEAHLSAYLQETCYWLAQKLCRNMRRSGVTSQYSAADLFQMTALELRPTLKSFDATTSENLRGFAKVALQYRLSATIRRQQLAGFCGPWGLLRKSSEKKLLAALKIMGLMAAEVERKRLLFVGFDALYTSVQPKHGGQLPEPTVEQLRAIADYYNQQRSGQLNQIAPTLTVAETKTQLLEISQALRDYLYPPIRSLNTSRFESVSGDVIEEQDMLAASDDPSLLEALLEAEEQQEQAEKREKLLRLLKTQFDSFNDEMQNIACLTYVAGLTQQKIAQKLDIPQATVSRRLQRFRQVILKAILAEQEAMDKFPEPDQLKGVKQQLVDCLELLLPQLDCCGICRDLAEDDSPSPA